MEMAAVYALIGGVAGVITAGCLVFVLLTP